MADSTLRIKPWAWRAKPEVRVLTWLGLDVLRQRGDSGTMEEPRASALSSASVSDQLSNSAALSLLPPCETSEGRNGFRAAE